MNSWLGLHSWALVNTMAPWHEDPWWRHQTETFSALLALCAGNSPVPGEFPTQRPVTRSFDVFFDLCQNKRLSKQSWGWWFETQSRPLWRHCNAINVTNPIEEGNPPVTGVFPSRSASIMRSFDVSIVVYLNMLLNTQPSWHGTSMTSPCLCVSFKAYIIHMRWKIIYATHILYVYIFLVNNSIIQKENKGTIHQSPAHYSGIIMSAIGISNHQWQVDSPHKGPVTRNVSLL